VALCSILTWACASDGEGRAGRRDSPPDTPQSRADEVDDWGEGWAQRPPTTGGSRAADRSQRSTTWAIVLATFPTQNHAQAAATTVRELPRVDARLAGGAWVHTSTEGSMVVYGRYDSVQSEDAQRDLKWIKQIIINDRPAFPRAMLSRINLRPAAAGYDRLELMSARQRYPHVEPLYTLQVAVWGDFESGKLSLKQIQRRAEEYARALRAQGFEAYYHHDHDKRLSMVTVGLFDHTAIDQRTGLHSPDVDALLDKFPAHLVNGETLLEPIDGRRLERGTRVQKPMLVHVPKL
jgi:hypothetical protein